MADAISWTALYYEENRVAYESTGIIGAIGSSRLALGLHVISVHS